MYVSFFKIIGLFSVLCVHEIMCMALLRFLCLYEHERIKHVSDTILFPRSIPIFKSRCRNVPHLPQRPPPHTPRLPLRVLHPILLHCQTHQQHLSSPLLLSLLGNCCLGLTESRRSGLLLAAVRIHRICFHLPLPQQQPLPLQLEPQATPPRLSLNIHIYTYTARTHPPLTVIKYSMRCFQCFIASILRSPFCFFVEHVMVSH